VDQIQLTNNRYHANKTQINTPHLFRLKHIRHLIR